MSSINTNQVPVRYGAKYLDADQLARQERAIAGAPQTIYGPGYLNQSPVEVVATVSPPDSEPAQFSKRQIEGLLSVDGLAANPDNFATLLHAESFRTTGEGPRKSVLVLLEKAAHRLEKVDEAAAISAMLDTLASAAGDEE